MFNSTNGYSLADLAAATKDNDFGGNGFWWIILFIIIFGGFGGYGWGGNAAAGYAAGAATTASGITDGYILTTDFANISRQIDNVQDTLRSQGVQLGNGISSLAYDQLNQMNGINNNINSATNTITAGLTALGTQMASGCCDLKNEMTAGFATLNYNIADQGNATRQAINDSTNAILGYLTQDKISTLEAENQSLKFAASQQAQNAYLVNALGSRCYCCGCNTNIG